MPEFNSTKSADTEVILDENPNRIRDLIFTTLSLTKVTGVPVLYLGNPGIAKTSGVRTWADTYGYKVTTLIGTQRVAEEILGYMVNDTGEKRLITYTPDWFDEIQENKRNGFKTLLFVDELSQAPDNVQGAMLQLIFDRRVGGRDNYLPEDCLVVSAANYKGNIPPQCGIQAPTLNRFMIINVQSDMDGKSLATEFLQSDDERMANIPVLLSLPITPQIENTARQMMKTVLHKVFDAYSTNKDARLDFTNTNYNEMFDQPGEIYNFISGRTIHYLYKASLGLIHLGVVRKLHKPIITNIVNGLAGMGTNTFENKKQAEEFQGSLLTAFQKVLRSAIEDNLTVINAAELNFKGKTLDTCISDWMRYQESSGSVNDVNLKRIVDMIKKQYPSDVAGMENTLNNFDKLKFLNELQKIDTFRNHLKQATLSELGPIIKDLDIIAAAYETYKTAVLNGLVK